MKFKFEVDIDLGIISQNEDQNHVSIAAHEAIDNKVNTLCNILTLKMWALDKTTLDYHIGYNEVRHPGETFFVFERTLDPKGLQATYYEFNANDLPKNVINALKTLNKEEICLKDELIRLDKDGFPTDVITTENHGHLSTAIRNQEKKMVR
jgi:hypothetical protein